MADAERMREVLSGPLTAEYFAEKAASGWKPVVIEWQREVSPESSSRRTVHEVPYGLRVSDDCLYLEENPDEQRVLLTMLDLIAQDHPLSRVAGELNQRGYRTRSGAQWTPPAVFELLPRLMEAGPHIVTSEQWHARSQNAFRKA